MTVLVKSTRPFNDNGTPTPTLQSHFIGKHLNTTVGSIYLKPPAKLFYQPWSKFKLTSNQSNTSTSNFKVPHFLQEIMVQWFMGCPHFSTPTGWERRKNICLSQGGIWIRFLQDKSVQVSWIWTNYVLKSPNLNWGIWNMPKQQRR